MCAACRAGKMRPSSTPMALWVKLVCSFCARAVSLHPPSPAPSGQCPPTERAPCSHAADGLVQPGAGTRTTVMEPALRHAAALFPSSGFPLDCCLAAAQEHSASGTCHAAPCLAEPWGEGERVIYGHMTQLQAAAGSEGLQQRQPCAGPGGADPPHSPLHQPCLHSSCISAPRVPALLLGCQLCLRGSLQPH